MPEIYTMLCVNSISINLGRKVTDKSRQLMMSECTSHTSPGMNTLLKPQRTFTTAKIFHVSNVTAVKEFYSGVSVLEQVARNQNSKYLLSTYDALGTKLGIFCTFCMMSRLQDAVSYHYPHWTGIEAGSERLSYLSNF